MNCLTQRTGWVLLLALIASAPSRSVMAASGHQHGPEGAAGAPPAELPPPSVLTNVSPLPRTVEVNLTAAPAALSLLPGQTTHGYAYNGRVPGPTLEAREGDRVIVHFRNNLPEPTTLHWHGLHLPVEMDGSPLDPVRPGGT
jgi:FtsP/CotA-like multicopper oxidase with cupredoxin domain